MTTTAQTLPAFKAAYLKVRRAETHLAELVRLQDEHLQKNPPKWRVESRRFGTKVEIQFQLKIGPADELISLVIGDCVHNLRSALDLMASDLALLNDKSPNNVYFPFASSESELDHQIGRKNFHFAGAAAVALLKTFRPYTNGNAALRSLHDLDIQDKHKFLIIQGYKHPSPEVVFGEDGNVYLAPDQKPTQILFVFPSGSVFEEAEIVPTLKELVQMTYKIIEAFEAISKTQFGQAEIKPE